MPYITEERRMIQEQAHEFTLNEVLPVANRLDPEKGDIPMDLQGQDGRAGLFRHPDPGEIRRPRAGLLRVLPGDRGAVARLDERRLADRARQPPDRRPHDERGTARPLSAPHGQGRVPGRLLHVGAERGFGHLQHLLPRQEGRRELADQRQQILVHLRRRRRLHDHHRAHLRRAGRQAPSRPLHVLPREEARRAAARLQRRADSQDRLFRLEDLRARLRQLPRARPRT